MDRAGSALSEKESVEDVIASLEKAAIRTMSALEVHVKCKNVLKGEASHTQTLCALNLLIAQQGLRCTREEIRWAALMLGSMQVLKLLISSSQDVQFLGMEIFDQRYPGLTINDKGRKQCIKALLARGAHLGKSNLTP